MAAPDRHPRRGRRRPPDELRYAVHGQVGRERDAHPRRRPAGLVERPAAGRPSHHGSPLSRGELPEAGISNHRAPTGFATPLSFTSPGGGGQPDRRAWWVSAAPLPRVRPAGTVPRHRYRGEAGGPSSQVGCRSPSRDRHSGVTRDWSPPWHHLNPADGLACAAIVRPVQFRLLGPVEVQSDDGRVHTLARRQERDVLAVLLLNPGRVTPVDRLVALLWNDNPPGEPRRALHSHVSRIRRLLTEVGAADYDVALASPDGGYLLSIDPNLIDAHRFRRLVATAGQSVGLAERDRLLREALALWHGPPLNRPTTDPLRQRLCTDLDELYLQAQEQSLATGIDLGRHHELLADLAQLSIEYPSRQRLTELYMRALHLDGRTADALDVYQRSRGNLADTLGIDPDPALQDLHTAILRGEVLVVGAASPAAPVIPAQLPADSASFAGRTHPLDRLDALLAEPHTAAGTTAVVITTIDGTAGVGKTALAIHWAHRVVGQLSDGQLYVNLRGFDPGGQAMDPAAVVRAFLDALDIPPARIPTDPDAQTALYRSLLVDKRVLIVLDNARDSAQVRPLLPGAPGCLVVVTSRNQLTSLVAETGAHPLTVDLLTELEARELLIHRLGPDRLAAEPDAVTEIITRCARLPIALTLVAAHAALRPHTRLHTLAEQLRDSRQRWQTLAGDDPATDLQSLFSWSYHTLTPASARLFRLL